MSDELLSLKECGERLGRDYRTVRGAAIALGVVPRRLATGLYLTLTELARVEAALEASDRERSAVS